MLQTSGGYLLLYKLGVIAEQKGLYEQVDSPHPNLRRDSAELFIKEVIPPLDLTLVSHCAICCLQRNSVVVSVILSYFTVLNFSFLLR
jgi:hypothetical protein